MRKVFNFLFCSLAIGISASCSKKLADISTGTINKSITEYTANSAMPVGIPTIAAKCLFIDTLIYSFNNQDFVIDAYYNERAQIKTLKFYQGNAFRTQWLFDKSPNDLYYVMLETLKNAIHYGLVPEDYDVTGIETNVKRIYANGLPVLSEVVYLDVHITKMYFLFTTHLQEGKVRVVGNVGSVWKRPTWVYPMIDVSMLLEMHDVRQFQENIGRLQPSNEQYARLQRALDYYRFLENTASKLFPDIVLKDVIKPEESSLAIPFIRRKLAQTARIVLPLVYDSISGFADSLRYDEALIAAVKIFQLRHGLDADGIIGDKTIKYLNQSFRDKADVIALNMERMRWLPEGYGENYIVVNIPEYKLRVYENNSLGLEMKVIVGANNSATPVFNDKMEYIVFCPTWTVPTSIIREEIIPHLKQDPEYYSKKNYSFFKNNVAIDPASVSWSEENNPYQFRIVQDSGPQNSLGLVKFVMPNNMSVFLHDTPNHRLFSKQYRALSHGCVRLDEPARFASYLLRDQRGWDEERINKAMHSNTPATVLLKKHYDVHLEYRTAWVDDSGLVNFREDIYGHDKMQLMQLIPANKPALVL